MSPPEENRLCRIKNKTNWRAYLNDAQMIAIALVTVNTVNCMNDSGFSWLGLGVLLSGLAFVALTLYMRNTRFPN